MDRSRRDLKDDDHQHRHRHHHQDSTNRPKRNDDNDEMRQQNRSTTIRNVSDRQQQSSTEMTSLNSSFSTLLGQNSREGGGNLIRMIRIRIRMFNFFSFFPISTQPSHT